MDKLEQAAPGMPWQSILQAADQNLEQGLAQVSLSLKVSWSRLKDLEWAVE